MEKIQLTILGIKNEQASELIEDLRSIEGVKSAYNVLELSGAEIALSDGEGEAPQPFLRSRLRLA